MSELKTAKVIIKVTEPGKESVVKTPSVLDVLVSDDHQQAKAGAIATLKKGQNFAERTTFELVDVEYVESFDDFLKGLK